MLDGKSSDKLMVIGALKAVEGLPSESRLKIFQLLDEEKRLKIIEALEESKKKYSGQKCSRCGHSGAY